MRRDQHGVDDRHRTRFQNTAGVEVATAQAARVAGGLAALVAGRREAGLGGVVAAGAVPPGDGQRARLAERVLRIHGVAAGAEAARGDLATAGDSVRGRRDEVRGVGERTGFMAQVLPAGSVPFRTNVPRIGSRVPLVH